MSVITMNCADAAQFDKKRKKGKQEQLIWLSLAAILCPSPHQHLKHISKEGEELLATFLIIQM